MCIYILYINFGEIMDKKELAELLLKLETMRVAMARMQQDLLEIASKLRFIPVSEVSSSDDDMEGALNTPRSSPR